MVNVIDVNKYTYHNLVMDNTVKVISLNVNGLNIPEKRRQIVNIMRKGKGDIILLQETHFKNTPQPMHKLGTFSQWYYSNNPDQKTKGVAIAIRKNLNFQLENTLSDPNGRYLLIKGQLYHTPCTIDCVYFPNKNQIPFLNKLKEKNTDFANGLCIIGGDLNFPLDPQNDTSKGSSVLPLSKLKTASKSLQSLRLIDTWRFHNPTTKQYTHYSSTQNSYARIDYVFISQHHLHWLKEASIDNILWSDHAAVQIKLNIPNKTPSTWQWRLNESLLEDLDCRKEIIDTIKDYKQNTQTDGTSHLTKRQALKCVLRGILIKHGTQIKKDRQKKTTQLIREIGKLEIQHQQNLSLDTYRLLTEKRRELKQLSNSATKYAMTRLRQKYYEYGNKTGKLLARALRQKQQDTYIHKVKNEEGIMQLLPNRIAEAFRHYYKNLYNIPQHSNQMKLEHKIQTYLTENALPRIEKHILQELDSPIQLHEVIEVIKNLKLQKAPGPDGYSGKFYKNLLDHLAPMLTNCFNEIGPEKPLNEEFLLAYISVIPKPGKDLTNCSSYRPISLLNLDLKIYTKILASRLNPILPEWIHRDQTGFVRGREGKENTMKIINMMCWAKEHRTHSLLLSTDAEKAFDRVHWTFLKKVLENSGMGTMFINKIMALYTTPRAQIKINGILSEPFTIRNGTRQGCPLSPLLYVLCMEHLLIALRQNPDITGLTIKGEPLKIAAFADDLLLFLTKPLISLPIAMKELKNYGDLSNYKINMTKSEALPVVLPGKLLTQLKNNFKFHWQTEKIQYLGVHIPTDLHKIYEHNHKPLLSNLSTLLQSWNHNHFTWTGRISIIKMSILPKLLYLFQTLPITLPKSFFHQTEHMVSQFIWTKKKARLKKTILYKPKEKGGLGLPDFFSYYQASIVSKLVEHTYTANDKQWIKIENQWAGHPLANVVWNKEKKKELHIGQNSQIQALTETWKNLNKEYNLIPFPSPLIPLGDNLDFPPGIMDKGMNNAFGIQNLQLQHVLATATEPPAIMINKDTWTKKDSWRYLQIKNCLKELHNLQQPLRPLTDLERL
uniref:Reverse transcriptase domain-containing protein n=1 Tax=Xenopus tropicalis TaxID=8364 RepID=A0A803JHI8_XENTR